MPQLSPMLGFLMFSFVLFSYIVLVCGLSKKTPHINKSSSTKSSKSSFAFFK